MLGGPSFAPLKKERAYPSEDISIRIARRRGDTYNSASSWAKSVMMNIVDNEGNLVGVP